MGAETMREIKAQIYGKFRSEAECARKLGWSRQKLNKITMGKTLPNIRELNEMANVLDVKCDTLLHIFLDTRSTNG